jgi:hypothetical protein
MTIDFIWGVTLASIAHLILFLIYRLSCKHLERQLYTYIEILKHENSLYRAIGATLFRQNQEMQENRNNEGEEWKNS